MAKTDEVLHFESLKTLFRLIKDKATFYSGFVFTLNPVATATGFCFVNWFFVEELGKQKKQSHRTEIVGATLRGRPSQSKIVKHDLIISGDHAGSPLQNQKWFR